MHNTTSPYVSTDDNAPKKGHSRTERTSSVDRLDGRHRWEREHGTLLLRVWERGDLVVAGLSGVVRYDLL